MEEATGESRLGCLNSLGKGSLGDRLIRGLTLEELPLPISPLVAGLLETFRV